MYRSRILNPNVENVSRTHKLNPCKLKESNVQIKPNKH